MKFPNQQNALKKPGRSVSKIVVPRVPRRTSAPAKTPTKLDTPPSDIERVPNSSSKPSSSAELCRVIGSATFWPRFISRRSFRKRGWVVLEWAAWDVSNAFSNCRILSVSSESFRCNWSVSERTNLKERKFSGSANAGVAIKPCILIAPSNP